MNDEDLPVDDDDDAYNVVRVQFYSNLVSDYDCGLFLQVFARFCLSIVSIPMPITVFNNNANTHKLYSSVCCMIGR